MIEVVASFVIVLMFLLGVAFGFLIGQYHQLNNYRNIKTSWQAEIKFYRSLYITSERFRQWVVTEYCQQNNWKVPHFDSPLQSEIDFADRSPILE